MTAHSTITFNKEPVRRLVQLSAEATLRQVGTRARAFWPSVAPQETGLLEASFRTVLRRRLNHPVLLLMAGGHERGFHVFEEPKLSRVRETIAGRRLRVDPQPVMGAYYAFWVEVGWMAVNGQFIHGQHMLRHTGDFAAKGLEEDLRAQSAKRGFR